MGREVVQSAHAGEEEVRAADHLNKERICYEPSECGILLDQNNGWRD